MKTYNSLKSKGFTIVEVMMVVVLISIIASITILNYNSWQEKIAKKAVTSDLTIAATAFENERNFNNAYPGTFPSSLTVSQNVVLEMTNAGAGKYCINGYNTKYSSIRLSINSDQKNTVNEFLCSGATTGSTLGGTIPSAPTGTNIAPAFSSWTLAGTATYNASTDELTLGSNGSAVSPLVRVNNVNGLAVNAQFYATVQSPYATLQPKGGWHSGASYFGADGTTAVTNSANYTANGCAKQVTLNSWNPSAQGDCTYALGSNVIYVKVGLYSVASGFASSDLKIKSISFVLN